MVDTTKTSTRVPSRSGERLSFGTAPPPDPVQGTDAKGLAKPIGPSAPWPEPSVLTQTPLIDAGDYSPMT
jgi:hypothetical protein